MKQLKFLYIILLIFIGNTAFSSAQESDISAEVFGKLPEISYAEVSPDGSKILYLQNVNGKKIVVTRSLVEAGAQSYGIPPMQGEYRWARWVSNTRILASYEFSAMRGGMRAVDTSETRLQVFDWTGENIEDPIDTGGMFTVRSFNRERLRTPQYQDHIVDYMMDDPDHVLVQMDLEEQLEYGVYKLNFNNKDFDELVGGRRIIQDWRADKNYDVRYGDGVSRQQGGNKVRSVAYYRKGRTGRFEVLYEYDELTEEPPFEFVDFTDDPAVILVSMQNEHQKQAYYKFNVDTEEIVDVVISSEDHDIIDIELDENYELEQYTYVDNGTHVERLTDHGQLMTRTFAALFPNEIVRIVSQSEDKKVMVLRVSSPTNPGSYYILDLNKGALDQIAYNYAALDYEKLSPMNPISYQARDGLTINGYLSVPFGADGRNLPMIVMPHGGPWGVRDTWRFDYWVQFLTARGYAVLQMNYRGSSGYGQGFEELGYREWGGKMIDDINDGTKWAIEQGIADRDNICLVGGSYGGYAALQSVVKEPELYKCSAAFSPVADLNTFMTYRRNYTNFRIYQNFVESDEWSYEEASPADNLDKINVPVLVMHGDIDRVVRVDQSRDFYEKMLGAGKDIKYVELEGANHNLSLEHHRIQFLKEVELFLAEHID